MRGRRHRLRDAGTTAHIGEQRREQDLGSARAAAERLIQGPHVVGCDVLARWPVSTEITEPRPPEGRPAPASIARSTAPSRHRARMRPGGELRCRSRRCAGSSSKAAQGSPPPDHHDLVGWGIAAVPRAATLAELALALDQTAERARTRSVPAAICGWSAGHVARPRTGWAAPALICRGPRWWWPRCWRSSRRPTAPTLPSGAGPVFSAIPEARASPGGRRRSVPCGGSPGAASSAREHRRAARRRSGVRNGQQPVAAEVLDSPHDRPLMTGQPPPPQNSSSIATTSVGRSDLAEGREASKVSGEPASATRSSPAQPRRPARAAAAAQGPAAAPAEQLVDAAGSRAAAWAQQFSSSAVARSRRAGRRAGGG